MEKTSKNCFFVLFSLLHAYIYHLWQYKCVKSMTLNLVKSFDYIICVFNKKGCIHKTILTTEI